MVLGWFLNLYSAWLSRIFLNLCHFLPSSVPSTIHSSAFTAGRRSTEPSSVKRLQCQQFCSDTKIHTSGRLSFSILIESPIPSHGAFFGSGDPNRSPAVTPTFQRFAIARDLEKRRHNVRLGTHCSWEQHILVEYTSCGGWNMGLAARYVPAAQFNGSEF